MEYGYARTVGLFHEMRRERNRRSGLLELFEGDQISRRTTGSRPVVGSSRINNLGWCKRDLGQFETRRFIPRRAFRQIPWPDPRADAARTSWMRVF